MILEISDLSIKINIFYLRIKLFIKFVEIIKFVLCYVKVKNKILFSYLLKKEAKYIHSNYKYKKGNLNIKSRIKIIKYKDTTTSKSTYLRKIILLAQITKINKIENIFIIKCTQGSIPKKKCNN